MRKYRFSVVHAFYAAMGGFVFDISDNGETVTTEDYPSESSTNTRHTRHVPTPAAFTYIMKHFPHIIPDISEDSITDRSESSGLSKALLIVQVGWFCMDCASRLTQRLPLSLLEVSTAAHAFCTLLTYFVWWSKPLNVAEGTPMKGEEAREVYALLMCSRLEYKSALVMAETRAARDSLVATNDGQRGRRIILAAKALQRVLPISDSSPPVHPFRDRYEWSPPGSFLTWGLQSRPDELAAAASSPIIYGLVHFLAWNVHFPKHLERQLWHISSALVTFSGLAWAPLVYFMELHSTRMMFVIIVLIVMPLTYMLASGFLIVESFRQLFFLDPAAYQVASWSNYWPHFS